MRRQVALARYCNVGFFGTDYMYMYCASSRPGHGVSCQINEKLHRGCIILSQRSFWTCLAIIFFLTHPHLFVWNSVTDGHLRNANASPSTPGALPLVNRVASSLRKSFLQGAVAASILSIYAVEIDHTRDSGSHPLLWRAQPNVAIQIHHENAHKARMG